MERSPHRLFVWDTETRTFPGDRGELHVLKVWAAETVQRHDRRPRSPRVVASRGRDVTDLVPALEGACRSTETTWAFAHNQGFDLAVTRLPLLLLRRGWTITAHALTTASPWVRLARGGHRLVLADSTSWLPYPLGEIAGALGMSKVRLPALDDAEDEWYARCQHDVRILTEALCQLMDWWDRCKLGSWSITGPQTGFNLLRHIPSPHTVVIDPDEAGRAFERRAITAGRREVWRVGRQMWGDYREIDFKLAHATIAAHCPLPKRRSVHFESMELDDWRLSSERWAPIAECEVQASTPRYPLEVSGRLFYPLGRFRTILCGPELAEARRRGELLRVGPGYVYQLGQHMSRWGRWVLDQLERDDPDTPAVARLAIKAWSRQVPGKWAARTGRTFLEGPAAEQGWALEHGRHHPSGCPVSILDMAEQRQVVLQDQEADDAFPAVLAWIQSEVRVRLGRLVDAVGPENMVACNTDGLICEGSAITPCPTGVSATWPLQPREKARYEWVEVISPQHVILPAERRLSGVPASADEVGRRQYRWLTWPRLPSQIAEGSELGYVRKPRTVDLSQVPVNRWVLADGTCSPVQAELDELDGSRLQPFEPYAWSVGLSRLREAQHPVLAALLSDPAA